MERYTYIIAPKTLKNEEAFDSVTENYPDLVKTKRKNSNFRIINDKRIFLQLKVLTNRFSRSMVENMEEVEILTHAEIIAKKKPVERTK